MAAFNAMSASNAFGGPGRRGGFALLIGPTIPDQRPLINPVTCNRPVHGAVDLTFGELFPARPAEFERTESSDPAGGRADAESGAASGGGASHPSRWTRPKRLAYRVEQFPHGVAGLHEMAKSHDLAKRPERRPKLLSFRSGMMRPRAALRVACFRDAH
jgi:hypothetical protein